VRGIVGHACGWNMHVFLILPFTLFFAIFEGVYVSSILKKVPQGGWCPFQIATILVILVVWNMHVFLILPFTLFFAIFEGFYLSSVLTKVPQGGWCPFVIATIFLTIMFSWK